MAKKEQKTTSFRIAPYITLLALALLGGGWAWQSAQFANWKDQIFQYVDNRDIATLEARFLPEQLIEAKRGELLKGDTRTHRLSSLKYIPYLLLDVKYPDHSQTREGILLWGLNDGEMVINTETWETSHGFRDCLECRATRSDFKILQTLAKRQGAMSIEELQKELHLERDILNSWIEEAKKKHLIVQKGNALQLHFENPKLLVTPQTTIKQHLVMKPLGSGQKTARNFSLSQIRGITEAAFGPDFTIRSEREIFLPVYSLEILNPDGSVQTSEWNALTGKPIAPRYTN